MDTRQIGNLNVSVLGLGCNNFGARLDQTATTAVVNSALDVGVNYFDTADVYGDSETLLGRALGDRRDEAVIATKFGHPGAVPEGKVAGSASWVAKAAERSLSDLGVDVIDHYQMHKPDPTTPIEETLGALQELIDAGKVREIGCSNFSAGQLDDMVAAADANNLTPFASVQNRYSVLTRGPETDGVLDACDRHGISLVPYFPLESGLLTGKYRKGADLPAGSRLEAWADLPHGSMFLTDPLFDSMEALITYAESRDHTILELGLSWLAGYSGIPTVIAGATSPDQVAANAAACSWTLDPDERSAIEALRPE
jgi:aryl-alcohol dehydrogenase-like predicted oxidoreductase